MHLHFRDRISAREVSKRSSLSRNDRLPLVAVRGEQAGYCVQLGFAQCASVFG